MHSPEISSTVPAVIQASRLSRRSVLMSGAGLSVVVLLGLGKTVSAVETPKVAKDLRPNAWITIDGDGVTSIISPASEMGQGVMTSMPLLIAEEMDADWSKVRVIQAPSDAKTYGNPGMGGLQLTGGSKTTPGYFEKLRLVGAQTRRLLLVSASEILKAPVDELTTDIGCVVHRKTSRRLSYGEIAWRGATAQMIPDLSAADLKRPDQWRYIGARLPRVDVAAKTDGSAKFGIDVQLPGLVHGAVLRPPVQGEKPISVDDAQARAINGVIAITTLPHGVGIVANTVQACRAAKDALKVTWSNGAKARGYSSDAIAENYKSLAADLDAKALEFVKQGNARAAIAGASRTLSATYITDHVHHATMEPMNATALVTADRVEVWASVQAQTMAQNVVAKIAGIPVDKVAINTLLLGGGLGRRSEIDFVVDAVLLAKAMPGRPVKVMWSREDDVRHGKYRPLTVQNVQVGLGAKNDLVGWRHRIVADSVFARYFPPAFEKAGGFDEVVAGGIACNYAFPTHLAEYRREQSGVDVGFWRAVGPGYTKFALECMIDEVAAARSTDPVAFRLQLLNKAPRGQAVIRTAAEMAQWSRKRSDTALGIAYSDAFGSHCAQVAEIALDRKTGAIRVVNVWCAIDPGVAIQPWNIEAQAMGGIVHGISHALHEQINIINGEVQESNFDTYRVLRMSETPEIRVRVVPTPTSPPGGIGETGVPPIAPAIANAFATLTGGIRLRHLPFLPDRVLGALKA